MYMYRYVSIYTCTWSCIIGCMCTYGHARSFMHVFTCEAVFIYAKVARDVRSYIHALTRSSLNVLMTCTHVNVYVQSNVFVWSCVYASESKITYDMPLATPITVNMKMVMKDKWTKQTNKCEHRGKEAAKTDDDEDECNEHDREAQDGLSGGCDHDARDADGGSLQAQSHD